MHDLKKMPTGKQAEFEKLSRLSWVPSQQQGPISLGKNIFINKKYHNYKIHTQMEENMKKSYLRSRWSRRCVSAVQHQYQLGKKTALAFTSEQSVFPATRLPSYSASTTLIRSPGIMALLSTRVSSSPSPTTSIQKIFPIPRRRRSSELATGAIPTDSISMPPESTTASWISRAISRPLISLEQRSTSFSA